MKLFIGWIRTRLFAENFAGLEKMPLDILDTILKWSDRADVTKISDLSQFEYTGIGFLADSGETIKGKIVRQAKNRNGIVHKVFLHFENDEGHMEIKKFGWFDIPSERFRLVPTVRPDFPKTDFASLQLIGDRN